MPRLTITMRRADRDGERVRIKTGHGEVIWLSYRGLNRENPHTAVFTFEAGESTEIMRECRLLADPEGGEPDALREPPGSPGPG